MVTAYLNGRPQDQIQARMETKELGFVSTGHLPIAEMVPALVSDAHGRYKPNTDGEKSKVCPALLGSF